MTKDPTPITIEQLLTELRQVRLRFARKAQDAAGIQDELADLRRRLDELEASAKLLKANAPPAQAAAPSPPPPRVQTEQPAHVEEDSTDEAQAAVPVEAPAPAAPDALKDTSAEDTPPPAPQPAAEWIFAGERPRQPMQPHRRPRVRNGGATGVSLEEIIGGRWMLFAGVAVMVLGGVLFLKFAYDKGWINPVLRCIGGAAFGIVIIGFGEWSLRRGMRLFAGALYGLGIVWLYKTVYAAGPGGLYSGYDLISTPLTFLLMCVVTGAGIALAVRSNILAAAVIALAGALATPVMLSTGTNRQTVLMLYLLIVNAGFLAVAFKKHWQSLAPLALAGTIVLFGGWFWRHYSGDQIAGTLFFGWLLLALPVAWAVAAISRGRAKNDMAGMVLLAAISSMAILLLAACNSSAHGHAFALQLLALTGGVYAFALWRKWKPLAMLGLIGAALAGYTWFAVHSDDAVTSGCVYLWMFVALNGAYALAAIWMRWEKFGAAQVAVTAPIAVLGWLMMGTALPPVSMGLQLLVLNLLVLVLRSRRGWRGLRAGVLAWTSVALALQWLCRDLAHQDIAWHTVAWSWVFFAMITADVMLHTWHRKLVSSEGFDSVVVSAAMAIMYTGTYCLLREAHADWMGAYTALLGAGAIATAWLVRRKALKRTLGYAYLGQGMVLAILAVPIQFNYASVTIAWSVQAVVAMFLARRLGNRMLLATAPILLALATCHFAWELGSNALIGNTLFAIGSVEISLGLVLMLVVTASYLLAAALVRRGMCLLPDFDETAMPCAFTVAAMALFALRTCVELPAVTATWWWAILAGGLAVVAFWRRVRWLAICTGLMLVAAAAKWLLYDTLILTLTQGPERSCMVIANWQFVAGVALAVGLLAFVRSLNRRRIGFTDAIEQALAAWPMVLAAVMIVWAGSFEIDRFFADAGAGGAQAMHTAYSLWWAVYATALLVIGFVRAKAPLRYLAMAIFAITLVKVFVVDMKHVEAVYRILSFLGLGLLLIISAWFYNWKLKAEKDAEA